MSEELNLKIKGVYSAQNDMSEVPPGALAEASNLVIDQDSYAESRRGFKRYGTALTAGAEDIRRLFPYQSRLLAHFDDTLAYDSGSGTWVNYSGTFEELDFRLRDAQMNLNLYLTTAAGVKFLDLVTDPWRQAGVPRPLDGTGSTTGVSGFLPDDSAVAYRLLLFYTDLNKNEKKSAPSQRLIVANTSGGTRDVALIWYLPEGLTTLFGVRAYRTGATADSEDDPGEEAQLVYEAGLTSTDISNGFVTFVDATPDELRGETIYTAPSLEGIANQNDTPPLAQDIVVYKQHLLYANVRSKHRFNGQLVGAGSGGLTYVADASVATMSGSPILTSITTTADMHVGMKPKGAGIPTTARILTIDSNVQVTMTQNATASATVPVEFQDIVTVAGVEYFAASATVLANHEFEATINDTPATNIELTTLSLLFTVNQDPTGTAVYGFYTTGFDDLPGLFSFEERGIGAAAFTISSTAGDAFTPNILTAVSSDNSAGPNTIMASKPEEPEAVPLKNKFRAGTSTIQRILALSDAAYVLSDQIYRFSGDDVSNFRVEPLDSTAKLIAPESAVVFDNKIFCMTNQGVVSIGPGGGVAVVSRPIEDDLQRISSDLFPQFLDATFALGYETSRRYVLWVPNEVADLQPTKAWVYNAFTLAWTYWDRSATAGVVDPANDKMHIADYALGYIFQERKSFARTDFADEEFAVTISAFSGTTVTVNSTASIAVGYLLVQDYRESLVTEVTDGTHVEVADTITWELAAATFFQPIASRLRWVPFTAQNPAILKHWQEITIMLRRADFTEASILFSTNLVPLETAVAFQPVDLGGAWGAFPWGEVPWGLPQRTRQVLRTYVPKDLRRSHWINIALEINEVFGSFQIAGAALQFANMTTRFRERS